MISFKSLEHALASVGHEIVTISKAALPILRAVNNSAPVVEAVTSLIDPAAVPIERAAYAVLGKVVAAAQPIAAVGAGEVKSAGQTLTLLFSAEEIADLQAVGKAIQEAMAARKVTVAS